MRTEEPLVTIGLPVYNGAETLPRAIDTLLAQTHHRFRIFISDNGSTDATPEICSEYARRDPRVAWDRLPRNRGAAVNFERVARQTKGEFFMLATADGEWHPSYIRTCLEALENQPSAVLAYTSTTINPGSPSEHVLPSSLESANTVSPRERVWKVHREIINRTATYGVLRADILKFLLPIPKVLGSDHILIVTLAALGPIIHIPQILFSCRMDIIEHGFPGWRKATRHYQGIMDPDTPWPQKYASFVPTMIAALRRIWTLPIPNADRIALSLSTIQWAIRKEIGLRRNWNPPSRRSGSQQRDPS